MSRTKSKPKYRTFKKGQKPPSAFREPYSDEEIEGFKQNGVRFRISAQSPFPKPKPKSPKKEVVIEAKCLKEIKDAARNAEKLEEILAKFKGTELKKIGKELCDMKFSGKEKVRAVRAMVFEALRSEFVWKAIVGEDSYENDH